MCSCIGSFLLDVATTCWLITNSFNLPIFYSSFAIRLPVGRLTMRTALALPAASQPPPPDPSMLTQSDLALEPQEVPDALWAWFSLRGMCLLTWACPSTTTGNAWTRNHDSWVLWSCRTPTPSPTYPPCLCHSCRDDPHVRSNLWTYSYCDVSCETWTPMNEHSGYSSTYACWRVLLSSPYFHCPWLHMDLAKCG